MTKLCVVLLGLFLLLGSCKEKNTESPFVEEENDNSVPGKRNFVWSIDSVSSPGREGFASIWGSSPMDVWAAAYAGPFQSLWHYDGVSWRNATAGTPLRNGKYNEVGRVWGTARNNVWAVGGGEIGDSLTPFVMNFNGQRWVQLPNNSPNMPDGASDLYGTGASEFWIAASSSFYHYNNGRWERHRIPNDTVWVNYLGEYRGSIYAITQKPAMIIRNAATLPGFKFAIHRYRNNRITKEDEFETILFEPADKYLYDLCFRNGKIYTSGTYGIFSASVRQDGTIADDWQKIYATDAGVVAIFFKHNNNSIYTLGGQLHHFNGTDWQRIEINVPNHTLPLSRQFRCLWTDGNEIFIHDEANGVTYHGR
jgi:hypothetical protein